MTVLYSKMQKGFYMKSSNKKKIKAAVAIAVSAALAAGCSTSHHAYNTTPAPVVTTSENYSAYPSGSGAPSSYTSTESGGATTSANDIVVPLQKEVAHVGTEQVNDGGVRIHKEVKTETVSQPVQVRRETVTVERVPAGSSAAQSGTQNDALNTPFKEGDVTVNLMQEKPMAMTEVVPAGSVVIHKQVTTTPQTVQTQVRSEEVKAVPVGSGQNVTISGNLNGSANEGQGAPGTTYGQTSGGSGITECSQLTSASDPTSLAGQSVKFDVKVQKVINDQTLAVGEDSSPVMVRCAQPISGISAGQTVSVKGVVQKVPSDLSGWDQQTAQALQGQKIFVNASSVSQ